MPSNAKAAFLNNKLDVARLWEIHQGIGGTGPGRKHKVEVLNRAAVVFITSCWEAFVEDVALEGFDYMVANAPSAAAIPPKVQVLASEALRKDSDGRKIWAIADGGWRAVVQDHRADVVKRWISNWNTPKAKNVDELFAELLGIGAMSQAWKWQSMSANKAKANLDKYVTIRGQIAHRVTHTETVYKNWSTTYLAFIEKLVDLTDDAVRDHVQAHVGTAPW